MIGYKLLGEDFLLIVFSFVLLVIGMGKGSCKGGLDSQEGSDHGGKLEVIYHYQLYFVILQS